MNVIIMSIIFRLLKSKSVFQKIDYISIWMPKWGIKLYVISFAVIGVSIRLELSIWNIISKFLAIKYDYSIREIAPNSTNNCEASKSCNLEVPRKLMDRELMTIDVYKFKQWRYLNRYRFSLDQSNSWRNFTIKKNL